MQVEPALVVELSAVGVAARVRIVTVTTDLNSALPLLVQEALTITLSPALTACAANVVRPIQPGYATPDP